MLKSNCVKGAVVGFVVGGFIFLALHRGSFLGHNLTATIYHYQTIHDDSNAFRLACVMAWCGNPDASFVLAQMYQFGEGTTSNYSKSRWWYLKSADNGGPVAQRSLGYYYEKGLGGKQDIIEAYKWYSLSEESSFNGMRNALKWAQKNKSPERFADLKKHLEKRMEVMAISSNAKRLEKQMSLDQLTEAKERIGAYRKAHPISAE